MFFYSPYRLKQSMCVHSPRFFFSDIPLWCHKDVSTHCTVQNGDFQVSPRDIIVFFFAYQPNEYYYECSFLRVKKTYNRLASLLVAMRCLRVVDVLRTHKSKQKKREKGAKIQGRSERFSINFHDFSNLSTILPSPPIARKMKRANAPLSLSPHQHCFTFSNIHETAELEYQPNVGCVWKNHSLTKKIYWAQMKTFEGDSSYFRVARRAHEERENIFFSDISHRRDSRSLSWYLSTIQPVASSQPFQPARAIN